MQNIYLHLQPSPEAMEFRFGILLALSGIKCLKMTIRLEYFLATPTSTENKNLKKNLARISAGVSVNSQGIFHFKTVKITKIFLPLTKIRPHF